MAKRKHKEPYLIDTDPTIGSVLRFDATNAQDFMDRKLRDIEGLLAGVMAITALDRFQAGNNPEASPTVASVRSAPKVMLESALLALNEFHTVASELARRYQVKNTNRR